MNIDLIKIMYLFFRLSPIIIVSYFALSSIFNQDLKGIVYLGGLLLTCLIVHTIWSTFSGDVNPNQPLGHCGLTFMGINNTPFSNVPLGLTTLAYTLGYIGTFIGIQKLAHINIPTLIILPLLVIVEAMFLFNQSCNSPNSIGLAIVGGGGLGLLWALIINENNIQELKMYTGISSSQVCSRPTKKDYKCVKKPNPVL